MAKAGAKLVGFEKVAIQLRNRAAKHKPLVEGIVGYSAPYATAVHEDTQKFHANGQSKFLETPLRQHSFQIAAIVNTEIRNGKSLSEAIDVACQFLLAQSQPLVPVDTGYLKSSGYVKVI